MIFFVKRNALIAEGVGHRILSYVWILNTNLDEKVFLQSIWQYYYFISVLK
jgi:hypothetical protein